MWKALKESEIADLAGMQGLRQHRQPIYLFISGAAGDVTTVHTNPEQLQFSLKDGKHFV